MPVTGNDICCNNPIDWESIAGKPDFCEKIDGLAISSATEYLSTVPNDIMWNKVYIVDCEKAEEEQTASILDEKE